MDCTTATDGVSSRVSRRVLIVDDNPGILTSLTLALTSLGHEVQQAGNGVDALAVAVRFAPEVVVLDIGLPDMDGYALAKALREQPQTAEAVLIAVTGYAEQSDRECAYAAGCDHHLAKPARLQQLLAVLNTRRLDGQAAGD